MKKILLSGLLLMALSLAAFAQQGIAIGQSPADFKLKDLDGKEQTFTSLKGKQGTVIIFVSTRCPFSNGFNERMEKLAGDYRARGINVVGVNANAKESVEDIKSHSAEHKFSFPVMKDEGNALADRFGAQVTPEAYLFDAAGKLVYHGRISNSAEPAKVTSNDLSDAIDAVVAGKPVERSEAKAFGCSIGRARS